ncbi:MAG: hypothetical protein O7G85_08280 [Planctomycetota bacterium]|nr:hypothetical protein [Planctomycetota bacterium]
MFSRKRTLTFGLAILASCSVLEPVLAEIKLITLPPRERVEIQLDHANATLVEEERIVPLAQGVNDVVFAWTNTYIDRNSIVFRCLTNPEEIKVLSVESPPGQNALVWQVFAPEAGSARIRVSYLIGQLNKSFMYRATAAPDEKSLTLWQYIRLHNNANESFGVAGMWPGFGERIERPIGINETKQLLTNRFDNVAIRKKYTADLSEYGYLDAGKRQLRIPMHYVLKNDERHGLGQFPLKFGKARIFQDDGQGTTAFLGEDWLQFTPRDDEAALYLGVAKDIVVKRNIERREQERVRGQLYDYDIIIKYEIENFKDMPATLDIIEHPSAIRNEIRGNTGRPVQWDLAGNDTLGEAYNPGDSESDRLVFRVTLPERGDDQKATKIVHTLHLVIRNEW